MTFKTSLDDLAKALTITASVIFTFAVAGQMILFNAGEPIIATIVTVLLLLVYLRSYLLSPLGYEVTHNEIIIHRRLRDIILKRGDIANIELADDNRLKHAVRILGVGGFFGYFGRYFNREMGVMTWYATRRNKTVLISTHNNKKIVLTPDCPRKFLNSFVPTH